MGYKDCQIHLFIYFLFHLIYFGNTAQLEKILSATKIFIFIYMLSTVFSETICLLIVLTIIQLILFCSFDQVVRLMDEVECIFIKHFANNDRKKAMKFLRPQQNKDSHMVTFFVGKYFPLFQPQIKCKLNYDDIISHVTMLI